eukprot:9734490-Ditylum_brightwellii.AAC.1
MAVIQTADWLHRAIENFNLLHELTYRNVEEFGTWSTRRYGGDSHRPHRAVENFNLRILFSSA